MSESRAAATAPAGGMSELGRLAGVFWEPGPVFRNLVGNPRFMVPIVIGVVLALAFTYFFGQVVGWDNFLKQELANNARLQQLSAEQQAAIVAQQSKFAGIMAYAASLLGGPIVLLIVGAVLLFVFKIGGAPDLSFQQSLAVVAYSWLPFSLYQALALVALFFTNPDDFNLKNPLPFNAGWFLDPSSSKAWVVSLLSSIDIFSFWVMALMALGYSVAAKKVRYGKAFLAIIAVWVVFVLGKSGLAVISG